MNLLQLLDYQTWADEKLFYFLSKIPENEKIQQFENYTSIKDRMAHIVMTLEVWYERLEGYSPPNLPEFEDLPADEIISKWREYNTKLSTYFSDVNKRSVRYTNSKGISFEDTTDNIGHHIINHTTFYRSQIIMMIRMLGYEVENTDYIVYLRSLSS